MVGLGVRNINEQTAIAVGKLEHVRARGDDVAALGNEHAVLVHQWKRKGVCYANRLDADGNQMHGGAPLCGSGVAQAL